MNKHTRIMVFALVLITILLLATGSAAAKATRTPFTGTYFDCGPTGPPEKIWPTGNGEKILHVRGEPVEGWAVSDNPYYNAYTTAVQNYDLNLSTGSGGVHGTFVKDVDGYEGGWEGTFAGYFKDGLAYTNVVGHGTGDLAGMMYFARFAPGENTGFNPCDGAASVIAVSGVILDTRGD